MKSCLITCLVALGFLSASPAALGAGGKAAAKPPTLEVRINVPPSWDPFLDDRVAEAFVDRVRESMWRQGFRGRVEQIDPADEVDPYWHLLTINLLEWRISHTGNIQCSFAANLQTPATLRQLGLYTNTSMRLMIGPGRFGLTRAFEEAAEGAIRRMCEDIARAELLPGFRT